MSADEVSPSAPKLDPEALAIRAQPARAIRFRRAVIVGLAGGATLGLGTVTWVALKPSFLSRTPAEIELSQPPGKAPADALAALPANYDGVPRLGPPLPGDLGRPILEHERQLNADAAAPGTSLGHDKAVPTSRDRLHDQQIAARQSGLMVNRSAVVAAATSESPPTQVTEGGALQRAAVSGLDLASAPGDQQHKVAFASPAQAGNTNPNVLVRKPSPYVLAAGSVIPASLITGLRSDLPGMVVAQVTERVFDSATGRIELIPQGARLIGKYDSMVAFGQKRALIAWQRLIMPDGSSLELDNAPATDAAGYAGLEDQVDLHSFQLMKGLALSSVLGVGSQLALRGDGDLVAALRRSVQDNAARTGEQLTMRNLDVQPTITVRPGAPVRLLVHKDLILVPWVERN